MYTRNGTEIVVNGKVYPMWSQFIEKKEQFIGGAMEDFGDAMDRIDFGLTPIKTDITDIILIANGEGSAWFEVKGGDFSCGFDVRCGGIIAGENGWLTFSGYGGHKWRIKTKAEANKIINTTS